MDFDNTVFSVEHEWVRVEGDGADAIVGITEFAAGELGDIVFVEFPEVGAAVKAGDTIGTIEAVKTVADLYSPVSGKVSAVNPALEDAPETVNESPYGDGWFVKIELSDRTELDGLMNHEAYQEMLGKA